VTITLVSEEFDLQDSASHGDADLLSWFRTVFTTAFRSALEASCRSCVSSSCGWSRPARRLSKESAAAAGADIEVA
jgi:hypothetical protein